MIASRHERHDVVQPSQELVGRLGVFRGIAAEPALGLLAGDAGQRRKAPVAIDQEVHHAVAERTHLFGDQSERVAEVQSERVVAVGGHAGILARRGGRRDPRRWSDV